MGSNLSHFRHHLYAWNEYVSEALGSGYIAVCGDGVVIALAGRKKREWPPSKGVPGNRRRLAWEHWLRGTRSRHIAHRFWITPTIRDRTQSSFRWLVISVWTTTAERCPTFFSYRSTTYVCKDISTPCCMSWQSSNDRSPRNRRSSDKSRV